MAARGLAVPGQRIDESAVDAGRREVESICTMRRANTGPSVSRRDHSEGQQGEADQGRKPASFARVQARWPSLRARNPDYVK